MRMPLLLLLPFVIAWPARAEGSSANSLQQAERGIEKDHEEKIPDGVKHLVLGKDAHGQPTLGVVVTNSAIEIRDSAGNPVKAIPREENPEKKVWTHVYQNEHANNVAVHTTCGYSERRESWESGEYVILDRAGNETLHIRKFDDDTRPVPSPSGAYAVGWPGCDTPGGPPVFYDASGYRNKWAHGFSGDEKSWPKEYGAERVRFSADGRYVGIVASEHGCGGPNPRLILFDEQGNKLWEAPPLRTTNPRSRNVLDMKFSPTGDRVVYWRNGVGVSAADLAGNMLWASSADYVPEVFSADGKMFLALGRATLLLVSMGDGHVIWSWEAPWQKFRAPDRADAGWKMVERNEPDFVFVAMTLTPDSSEIAAVGTKMEWQFLEPGKPQGKARAASDYIFILDRSGNLISKRTLPGGTIFSPSPAISISDDGKMLAVQGPSSMLYFAIHSRGGR